MSTVVQPATESDLLVLRPLGAILLKTHHEFDQARFLAPDSATEQRYVEFLASQFETENAAVLVAERDNEVLGYLYATIEPATWSDLRPETGFIHDVAVVQSRRGAGIASTLVSAALAWFRERGSPRVSC